MHNVKIWISSRFLISLLCLTTISLASCKVSSQGILVELWEGLSDQEDRVRHRDGVKLLSHIENPTIEVFIPEHVDGKAPAVIICPGGGYGFLAYDWEGTQIAQWLNEYGIVGIALKYRLPKPESGADMSGRTRSMSDVKQALNLAHNHAEEWKIDPNQIGIMGFSAGGHLAAYSSNKGPWVAYPPGSSQEEIQQYIERSKFAFSILIYPVISMADGITNDWTRKNLFGKVGTDYQGDELGELIESYSNENRVSSSTPPTFLVHSSDDDAVPVENSLRYYSKLREHEVPVEMHLYPTGGHGYSLFKPGGTELGWGDLCIKWIKSITEQ